MYGHAKNTSENRILWLDIAKGITIILMVVGHTTIPKVASNLIWAFHMPLFFIASGITTDYTIQGGTYILKKIKGLLLPFAIYSTIVLCIQLFCLPKETQTFNHWLTHGWEGIALWFIPVLFFASLIAYIIIHNATDSKRVIISGLLLAIISGALSYLNIGLPWTITSIPYASALIIIGYLCKPLIKYIKEYSVIISIIGFFVTLAISHFFRLDMAFNKTTPITVLTIGAVSGTAMIFSLSSIIEKYTKYLSRILMIVGKETYLILAFSQITIVLLKQYTQLGSIPRYLILVLVIVVLKYCKDAVNSLAKTKIL